MNIPIFAFLQNISDWLLGGGGDSWGACRDHLQDHGPQLWWEDHQVVYKKTITNNKTNTKKKSRSSRSCTPTQIEGLSGYIAKDKDKLNLVEKYGFQFNFFSSSGMSLSKCAPTTRIFWTFWVQTWDCNQSETYLWYPTNFPAQKSLRIICCFPSYSQLFWVLLCSLTVPFSLGFPLTRNILCSLSVPIIFVFPSLSVLINETHCNNAADSLLW